MNVSDVLQRTYECHKKLGGNNLNTCILNVYVNKYKCNKCKETIEATLRQHWIAIMQHWIAIMQHLIAIIKHWIAIMQH